MHPRRFSDGWYHGWRHAATGTGLLSATAPDAGEAADWRDDLGYFDDPFRSSRDLGRPRAAPRRRGGDRPSFGGPGLRRALVGPGCSSDNHLDHRDCRWGRPPQAPEMGVVAHHRRWGFEHRVQYRDLRYLSGKRLPVRHRAVDHHLGLPGDGAEPLRDWAA